MSPALKAEGILAIRRRIGIEVIQDAFIFCICFTAWVPFSINIVGLNLRLSQLILPIVSMAAVAGLEWQRVPLRFVTLGCAAALWWVTLLYWTANRMADSHAIGRVFLMGLNIAQAGSLALLVWRGRKLTAAIRAFIFSVAVFNALLLAITLGISFGLHVPSSWVALEMDPTLIDGALVGRLVPRFVFGGVLAGCISAAAIVMALCLALENRTASPRMLRVQMVLCGIGVVLGFSRQALVSLVAGLFIAALGLIFGGRVKLVLKATFWGALLSAFAVAIMDVAPGGKILLQAFEGRAVLLFEKTSYSHGTVLERAITWNFMWNDITNSPWTGNGQDAYLKYMRTAEDAGSHNFPLEVMHSSGLVGFVGYLLLHGLIGIWSLLKVISLRKRLEEQLDVLGLLGAFVAVTLASFTNLIYWNPTYWAVLGLLIAAVAPVATRSKYDI